MPIYAFRCRDCGEHVDVHRNFHDIYEETCRCGGVMRKVFTVGGVAFKGNGFYRTDNGHAVHNTSEG